MCIYEDVSDGSIWIITDGGGIFVMKDRKIIKTYTTDNGLVGNVIFKISKSSDGAFWICTGCGINRFYNNRFFSYTSELGLGTDSVFHMLVDDTGSAWMTSNGGISCITMSSIIRMFDGGIDHLDSRFFSRSDGLKTGGVTSTSLSMKDSKGRIWFTLIDGFAIYDPKNLSFNRTRPLVHIENISIDGKKVLWKKGDSFEVAAGTKRINIKYTGISFVSSELLRFTYKLEGFEKDFSSWQSNRTVSYTNLKPGKYVFHVFAKNGDNILSSGDATLTFTQKAFFYQRYSFWITVVLTVTLLIIFLVYSRINSLQKQQKLLETMVVERTSQLEAEKEKSDKLLLNILPEPVANKLKQNPDKVIADEKRNVSVLFADIVNFTKTTSNISPEELVSALNDLYSLFDMRAVREGIEKIKTIGDAYMAASGLTVEDLSHAEHLIKYARGMLSDVKEYNKTATIKFNMRIGINSGSVVAGVIGKSKYIYDIWGDTVNVASRMEHTGAESRIHVSEKTWQLCNNEIAFDEEVEVEVKGKGKMRTFYTK